MKLILISVLSVLSCSTALAQTGAVLKLRNGDTLTEDLATGAKRLKISSTGTLEFVSGFTLTGGSYLRTALGLGAAALLDTSTGGNGAADSGKAVVFDASGQIFATSTVLVKHAVTSGLYLHVNPDSISFNQAGGFDGEITAAILTANRTWQNPDKSGTYAMTSDITGTNSGTNTGDQTITLTGDVTGSGTGSFAATLANTAVTAGSYTAANITVDAKGRITAASNGSGGVSDGDKGSITVSGSGTVWTIDASAVTDSMLAGSITPSKITGTAAVLSAVNDFSAASAASTPAIILSGSVYTGSGAKPHLLLQPAAASAATFSTNGTAYGSNQASGFTGNHFDFALNGSTTNRMIATYQGILIFAGGNGLRMTTADLSTYYVTLDGSNGLLLSSNHRLGFSSTTAGAGDDASIYRRAANHLALGFASSTPAAQTFGGQQGSGTNITGGALNLGTRGTGTGTGGTVNLQSHAAGSSGTTLGTLATVASAGPSGFTIGTRGSAMSAVATVVKASHDCASIAAGATETTTATITGCVAGSTYAVTPNVHEGLIISALRTGSNTVTITFYNPTAGAIDASAVDVRVTEISF